MVTKSRFKETYTETSERINDKIGRSQEKQSEKYFAEACYLPARLACNARLYVKY